MVLVVKKKPPPRRSGCPISVALELLGDSWSLLVVRDLMFKGRRTFQEFLAAGEGVASNILSDRLSKLEAHGIVAKRQDADDARRFIYRLTEKGIDLAPLLVEVVVWAARHEQTEAPAATVREMEQHRGRVLAGVRKAWAKANAET
jgi:DNA-binding HxlR family transcriptional regulator